MLRVYHILCIIILCYVIWVIKIRLWKGSYKLELIYQLEYFFLIVPIIIIGRIIYISLPYLYNFRIKFAPSIMIFIGYQWYWIINDYEIYHDQGIIHYIIGRAGWFDTRVWQHENNRFTGRSNDVIHRIYIPSLFFKIDLIPGRITTSSNSRIGVGRYNGVCAEICGANHAFIPFKFNVVK